MKKNLALLSALVFLSSVTVLPVSAGEETFTAVTDAQNCAYAVIPRDVLTSRTAFTIELDKPLSEFDTIGISVPDADEIITISGGLSLSVVWNDTEYTIDYGWMGSSQYYNSEIPFEFDPETAIFSYGSNDGNGFVCGVFASYAELGGIADEILEEAQKTQTITVSPNEIAFYPKETAPSAIQTETTTETQYTETTADISKEFSSAVTVATVGNPDVSQDEIAKILISFVDENTGMPVSDIIKAEIIFPDGEYSIGFDTRWGNPVTADLVPDADGYTLRIDELPAGYTYQGETSVSYGYFGTLPGTQKIMIPLTIDETETTDTQTETIPVSTEMPFTGTQHYHTGTTMQYTSTPPDILAEILGWTTTETTTEPIETEITTGTTTSEWLNQTTIQTANTGDYVRDASGEIVISNGTSAVFSNMTSSTSTTTTTVTKTETAGEPLIPGNVNSDADIDILDVILVNRAVFGKTSLTDEQIQAADVNRNDKLDFGDSLLIMQYIVKLIDTFE